MQILAWTMDSSSFSIDEQRFVLAEIIKASTIDIDALMAFIQTKNISPEWMRMQLPNGRNMSQCMQFFKQISMHSGAWNGLSTSRHGQPASSRTGPAAVSLERNAPPVSPITKTPMSKQFAPIAPRPGNGKVERGRRVSSLAESQKPPPKKRGRPSKADMAKRDLKPILPKPIAPRPPLQTAGYDMRPLAPSHPREVTQTASPETMPAIAGAISTEKTEDKKRRRVTTPTS